MKNYNNDAILAKIKDIAEELQREGKTFLRSDIAYKLRGYGVEYDSSCVDSLIFQAYQKFSNNKSIASAFITNDGRNTIVNDYKLAHSLSLGCYEDAIKVFESDTQKTSSALDSLNQHIERDITFNKSTSSLVDTLVGTKGAKDIRATASDIFTQYSELVDAYHNAEDNVRNIIHDFTELRSNIEKIYHENADKLIDVFGDSIKAVSPDLFDFNRIEWLDVDQMLKYVELDYNKLTDKCSVLIGEISDSFQKSMQNSISLYKANVSSNKSVGLAIAGLGMINHYLNTTEKTNRLKTEFTIFQTSLKHDTTKIKADMQRLFVIFKTINDIIIPKAEVFLRNCSQFIESDLQEITTSLYNTPELKSLEEDRQAITERIVESNRRINDHYHNIDIYSSLVQDIISILESKHSEYLSAKDRKPRKPFFLVNILTFGNANKNYYRHFSEWNALCAPLVREYENYQVELKLNKDELESHKASLSIAQSEHKKMEENRQQLCSLIKSKTKANDELKKQMIQHLRSIVGMLRLGREIMETKLDERHLHTVSIPDYRDKIQLPEDVNQNIDKFTETIMKNIHVSENRSDKLISTIPELTTDNLPQKNSNEDIAAVQDASETTIQNCVSFFNSALKLQLIQQNNKLASEEYEKMYNKLTLDFKQTIMGIDNKAALFREIMKKINLSDNLEQKKKAFLLLREMTGDTISEQEFDNFLTNQQQILL